MQSTDEQQVTNIRREFDGATGLGDRRRESRLVELAERMRRAPEQSFPDLARTQADLTALYRFLNSESVTADAIMEPHRKQTALRCAEVGRVLVIHDTSEIKFSGTKRRNGLGRLRSRNDQGFLLHCALAVAADGSRRPLGVLGSMTWTRETLGRSRDEGGRKRSGGAYADDDSKESQRWWQLIDKVEDHLGGVTAIHVMDREADAYTLLRNALDQDVRFVTRMARDRVVLDEDDERIGRASEVLVSINDVMTIEVPLSSRAPKNAPHSTDPPREARLAKLAIGATRMCLAPPNYIDGTPDSVPVNVVYVHEIDAPHGIDPVTWVLITSEPIDTPEQVRAIVEIYQTRWLIEEFFKALKTGCAIEKRQLESYESLTNALAIFLPIAWQLLLLRNLARSAPQEPAELVLTPTQIQVLRAAVPRVPLRPTVSDALRAVAYLGGHFIKRDPGWLVLGRGLEKLLNLEAGWLLAMGSQRSDRS